MSDPMMQNSTFADRLISLEAEAEDKIEKKLGKTHGACDTNFVQSLIEEYWEKDDDYLTAADRTILEDEGLLGLWTSAYFDDLCNRYQGSCNSLSEKDCDFLEEFDLHDALSNIYFECTVCGWWYEAGEEHTQGWEIVCPDCFEGDEDE
jgi:hypothetical protein